MRIHHLNCASLRPLLGSLFNGTGKGLGRGKLVCHCLLLEGEDGLILIDTGIGHKDIDRPGRFGWGFDFPSAPVYDPAETALSRVRALGFQRSDVKHIVVTHLDLDHAGGLPDFPQARVHVHGLEYARAMQQPKAVDQRRYRSWQWEHKPTWTFYHRPNGAWFGFDAFSPQDGLDSALRLISLPGHSQGHIGVAIPQKEGWLFFAGDALFDMRQVDPVKPHTPFGVALFQWFVQWQSEARAHTLQQLQKLSQEHAEQVRICCTHDPIDLEALQRASSDNMAEPTRT